MSEHRNQYASIKPPHIQGRRALLVINCQKDAFNRERGANIANPPDFLDRIRRIIPYYRQTGTEIVWVTTDVSSHESTQAGDRSPAQYFDLQAYMPSSKQEEERLNLSDVDKAKKQNAQDGHWRQDSEKDLPLPMWRKTKEGTELVEELEDMFDRDNDIAITKNYFSAFDETPLLMGLRMKIVTNVHICGGLSNVSIIYSAAEAAQHGLEVSVVEDCMGYRDEQMHLEAMQKMADEVGVHGVDSEEIIMEATGKSSPDADLEALSGSGFNGINISESQRQTAAPSETDTADRAVDASDKRHGGKANGSSANSTTGRSKIGEGDSKVVSNALPPAIARGAFENLKTEVQWLAMKHRSGDVPRRVAVQGEIGTDGAVPVYRHPADECPPLTSFSPTVLAIRNEVSELLKQPFNHVLIQLYRTGSDNIHEHSDKTLDIVRGSDIINVSLGAQRKMTLRIKKSGQTREQQLSGAKREAQRVTLPHNSVFVLGPQTNARWLHGVRPDKRPEVEKTDAEKAYAGERISLTFRHIGTWTDPARKRIWGQGAREKCKDAVEIIHIEGDGNVRSAESDEAERMLVAFGRENHQSDFDWDKEYGQGFDALDLIVVNPPAS